MENAEKRKILEENKRNSGLNRGSQIAESIPLELIMKNNSIIKRFTKNVVFLFLFYFFILII